MYSLPTRPTLLIIAFLLAVSCTPDKQKQNEFTWPGEAWETSTPEAEGIDPAVVAAIHTDITQGKYGLMDEFVLIRHGKIVADYHYKQNYDSIVLHYDTTNHMFNYDHPAWHPYYKGTRLHSLQSVTKSVTSVALGIAIDEGLIKGVDVNPMETFTDYTVDQSDPKRKAMKLEDLLTMRSGIDWNEMISYESGENSCIIMEGSENWVQYVLGRPMREDPGTVWDYNSGVSVLLGKLVGIASGKRVDAYTDEKLFKPLGIKNYFWKTTPMNEVDTEGGLYLSSHDLARIGYLYLRNGKWGDKQIVSSNWVEQSTKPTIPDITPNDDKRNIGYGYQWWIPHTDPFIFAGNGYGGQFVMVAPAYDLVVVFNGWDIHDNDVPLSSYNALKDRIIPATKSDKK